MDAADTRLLVLGTNYFCNERSLMRTYALTPLPCTPFPPPFCLVRLSSLHIFQTVVEVPYCSFNGTLKGKKLSGDTERVGVLKSKTNSPV